MLSALSSPVAADINAGLLDVLRCLGSVAADSLIECLRDGRALPAARLSCRALRTFVDTSTTRLDISVRTADLERWEAGQRLTPLAQRWPRCRHVKLRIRAEPGDDAGLLALLPFAEPAAGRHIETLQVLPGMDDGENLVYNGENLVCMLVLLLPNLRDLDFRRGCMSYDPLQQQLMYSALASLPRLERLTLPGCRSLDRVGALAASNLRRLEIVIVGREFLSPAALAGLQRLERLEQLKLPYFQFGWDGSEDEPPSGVRGLLLAGFPASLRQLDVGIAVSICCVDLHLELRGGTFSHVAVGTSIELQLGVLAILAPLLLCSPAMGPTLELLSIRDCVRIFKEGPEGPQHAQQVQVHKLLQRCTKVECDGVWVPPGAPADVVMRLVPLLAPDDIMLNFEGAFQFEFSFPAANGEAPRISGSTAGAGPAVDRSPGPPPTAEGEGLGSQQCSPPPSAADLLRAALQRITVEGRPSSSCEQARSCSTEGGAAVVEVTGSSGTPGSSLLLLRGPFVAVVAKSGLAPTEWVRCLAAQADAAAPGNDWGGKPVLSCQAVPPVNGILVSCSSAAAAAAVAVAAGGAGEAAAPLQVLEVVSLQIEPHWTWGVSSTKRVLFNALELVMTAFGEGAAHGGEGCNRAQRLRCLLAVMEAFNALPAEVEL